MAKTQPDRIAINLVGQCGLTTDELYGLILFSRHFKYLFSLCWRGERFTKISRPKHDVAYTGKWCLYSYYQLKGMPFHASDSEAIPFKGKEVLLDLF